MELMRHSDMRLSTKTYMDSMLLPLVSEMAKLPSPMASPTSDKSRQNVGKPVQVEFELKNPKIVPFIGETVPMAKAVPSWENLKVAEREGFEPSEPLRIHMISNHAHSTTLPPLLRSLASTCLSEGLGAHS